MVSKIAMPISWCTHNLPSHYTRTVTITTSNYSSTSCTMAPNLNRNTIRLAPQALPLNLSAAAAANKDYQAPQPSVVDSESYWSWPARNDVVTPAASDDDVDVFSANHITANLVRAAAAAAACSTSTVVVNAENDSYWAEEEEASCSSTGNELAASQSPSLDAAAAANSDYWDESWHARNNEGDSYWTEPCMQQQKEQEEEYWGGNEYELGC